MKELQDLVVANDFIGLKNLIKNKIDINIMLESQECENIFFLALKNNVDFDILKLLIDSNLDLNYTDINGVGILDEAVLSGDLTLVKYLIEEKNLDPNITKRKSGFTPLMQASSYGYIDMIKYFIEYGVEIDQRDIGGLSAKDYSRKLGKNTVVNYFNSLEKL